MPSQTRTFSALALACFLAACGGGSTGPSGPPVVTSVNGATMPSGPINSTVVIVGSNFGASPGQVLFSNGTGGTIAATISNPTTDWTNTLIVTTVPSGAATGNLVVTASGSTSGPITFTVSQQAAFSPSAISWTSVAVADTLPVGLSGHAMASAAYFGTPTSSFVWVIGGADNSNAPRSAVLYAPITSTGVGTWTVTAALPAPVAFAAAVAATPFNSSVTGSGYLYVIGGDSSASGKPVATVYKGALNSMGVVTGWSTTTSLPTALYSVGAVIFNGSIYVVGGSGSGNVPVATAYRAQIQAGGGLGSWQPLASLAFARSYFGFGLNGTFLYVIGGDSAAVLPNDATLTPSQIGQATYAQIDVRTGSLTSAGWTVNSSGLAKVRSKHTAVVAGGNVLITAGLYNGATNGSSEETAAAINPDGSIASFGGATGVNTITKGGGGNVFNHAAVGYVDPSGAFHVLVAGGDDVNTPGTKHGKVFYY